MVMEEAARRVNRAASIPLSMPSGQGPGIEQGKGCQSVVNIRGWRQTARRRHLLDVAHPCMPERHAFLAPNG
jgi:hypothetical protein